MRAATCFSGIGAPECAMPEWDWRWSADIEPFPNAVRAERFPGITNLGDVLAEDFLSRATEMGPLDVLIGGPPCQDFSVAGLREGLNGARGNLTLRWVQIIHALRPRWAVTENVPGWLSVNGGRAFGAFLAGLVGLDTALVPPRECGGQWTSAGMVDGPEGRAAWRILDAQYFGLAQRRQRVFVVFCFGDRGDPAAVLFEPASLRGDPAPHREAGERVARPIAAGSPGGSGYRNDADTADSLIVGTLNANGKAAGSATQQDAECGMLVTAYDIHGVPATNGASRTDLHTALRARAPGGSEASTTTVIAHAPAISPALKARDFKGPSSDGDGDGAPLITHTLRAEGFDASEDGTGRGVPLVPTAFMSNASGANFTSASNMTPTLRVGGDGGNAMAMQMGAAVRRLTPAECEALQGFPRNYTLIPYRNGMAADGPRYRALGNSMAVPVVAWIGRRIANVDAQMRAATEEVA